MRTPREILLSRHRSAEPKLDRVWTNDLSTELRSKSRPIHPNVFLAAFWTVWRELVLPSQRIWAGLACAWILIFALNLAARDESPVVAKRSSLSREAVIELRQQELFFAELIGMPESPKASPPKSSTPGSRSERRREFREA